jgi:hypothetical protein
MIFSRRLERHNWNKSGAAREPISYPTLLQKKSNCSTSIAAAPPAKSLNSVIKEFDSRKCCLYSAYRPTAQFLLNQSQISFQIAVWSRSCGVVSTAVSVTYVKV